MASYQGVLLIIFVVVGYMIIIDPNVSEYLTLVFKMIQLNIERAFWMIRLHPRNPIVNLINRWKYDKIAKELQKEFDDSLR
jgi:hypothetical protein